MKVVVTGSRGVVGTVLVDRLNAQNHTVVPLVHDAFDVNDEKKVRAFLDTHQPDAIMHLAKGDVPFTKALAAWAYEKRKAYVFTSTYKVFKGKKVEGPFTVYDTPDGTDQLATSKQELERVSFAVNPNSYVARLAWQITKQPENYGIMYFIKSQMDKRGKISVSKNHFVSAMFVEDTADALIDLVEHYAPGLYHLNASDWFSLYDIVYHIKHKMGHDWIVLDPPRTLSKNEMLDNTKIKLTPLSKQGVEYQHPNL